MAIADEDLELDFQADWIGVLRQELQTLGHQPPASDEDTAIAYFNLLKRLIAVRPRRVHVAPALRCPLAVQGGLDEVRRKTEAGEDLRPHLSKTIDRRDFYDGLLNDWGIHHLHLGAAPPSDERFVARTRPVLFARFVGDDAFFITVQDHCRWGDETILEAFADAWPAQIAPYEMRGIAPSRGGPQPTNEERQQARAAGVQLMTFIQGKAYHPMGLGTSTARVGVSVVTNADRAIVVVRDFEQKISQGRAEIFSQLAQQQGLVVTRPLRLRLMVQPDGSASAQTLAGEVTIPLGDNLRRAFVRL